MIQSVPPPTRKPSAPARPRALKPATVAAVLGAALLLVVLIGWHVYSASSGPTRPDLPDHPGMNNLRQELQRGMAARSPGR